MGQSPPGSTYNEIRDGLPFYQGVADYGERYPSRRVYCTAPTRFAEKGDILLSVRAPIGRVNRASERCAIGRGLAVIRGESQLDTTYIEFFLRSSAHLWDTLEGQGSVFGNAKRTDLEKLSIVWPDKQIRAAIAHILGTLDDKIELNRKMSETLEAMARAIFKSWFVDFDPVRAKMQGRDPRLPKEIADLFPDSFEDSELGEIPKGWRVVELDEIASVSSGKRPTIRSDAATTECTIPLYGGGGRMGYVPSPLYEKPILFTGRVGTLGLIFRTTEPSWPSDNTLIIEPYSDCFDFTYFALKGFDLITLNRGSTQPLLTQTDLKRQKCVFPPAPIVKVFASTAAPIFQRIKTNENESRTLSAIRDALLPKLISGEVRVKDAKKLLEGVA